MIKEKLKEMREKKGFSQEQLAGMVGMTQSNYSRRESGVRKISNSEWDLLAKKLNVNKEEIFEEDNNLIYNRSKGNSSINNFGNISYFNVPDFVLEHIELLKVQNLELKEENKLLKEKIEVLKG